MQNLGVGVESHGTALIVTLISLKARYRSLQAREKRQKTFLNVSTWAVFVENTVVRYIARAGNRRPQDSEGV